MQATCAAYTEPCPVAGLILLLHYDLMPDIPFVQNVRKYEQVLKYLIAGGSAFAVNIVTLYVLTDVLHVYYLLSTVGAFLTSFGVSFVLQKVWTFRELSRDNLHVQLPLYLLMQLTNLGLNTMLMYVFVEYLHLWYILSQAIIAILIAIATFFINKAYIFKQRSVL